MSVCPNLHVMRLPPLDLAPLVAQPAALAAAPMQRPPQYARCGRTLDADAVRR